MRTALRVFAVLILAGFVGAAHAQDTPDTSRGFMPQNVYDFLGMESVAMFNGNLNLTIPLGQTYRANGRMPYHFGLVYNSNDWDYYDQLNGGLVAAPVGRFNAGFGWTFSLGEFYKDDPYNLSPTNALYVSPDGAEHGLIGPTGSSYGYSGDTTYLRAHYVNSTTSVIEFPDGARHTFTRLRKQVGDWVTDPNGTTWRLTAMSDAFGNTVGVSYKTVNGTPYYAEVWTITDGPRTHTAYFKEATYFLTALDHLDVSTFGGISATYSFTYQTATIPPGFGSTSSTPYTVSMLTSIQLPDGTSYYMTTDGTAEGAPAYATDSGTQVSGVLLSLRLPTKGYLKWSYEPRVVPLSGVSGKRPSVATRSQCGSDGCPTAGSELGKWTYGTFFGLVGCVYDGAGKSGNRQLTRWVTQPDGVTQIAYFNIFVPDTDVCYDDQPLYQQWDYGTPFAPEESEDGRFLSTETRSTFAFPSNWTGRGRAPGGFDAFTQSHYITWENKQVRVERTKYDGDSSCDGTVCYKQISRKTFDGFGHYRQTFSETNFPGSSKYRTTFMDFDVVLDANSDWVLGTATEQCTADESQARTDATTALTSCASLPFSATTKLKIDRSTGLLLGRRTLKNTDGSTLDAHDVLSMSTYDGHGNLVAEQFYGGDTQSVGTSAAFPTPPATPTHQIDHTLTYASGALASRSSAYMNFLASPAADFAFTLDANTFDPATGLASATRDAASLQTGYTYDSSGRLLTITPPSPLAATAITYTAASLSGSTLTPASADVQTTSGDSTKGKLEKKYFYDSIGRLSEQDVLMPAKNGSGGNIDAWSKVQTIYNPTGQKDSVSTQQSVTTFNGAQKTSFSYDASGKPSAITAPDGKQTTFARTGEHIEQRTVAIATSASGTTNSTTTYTYDRLGRIAAVAEPTGPTSATAPGGTAVTTTYGYDWGDRLTSVVMIGDSGSQSRSFTYDPRGFLTSEMHPESGTTTYSGFDARGHPTNRVVGPFDLTFEYDSAERLIHLNDLIPNSSTRRPLKVFSFSDTNTGTDYARGKLKTATRYNHPPSGDVTVVETYTYAEAGGAVSKKETAVTVTDGPSQTFSESFTVDDLGALDSITYPTCLSACSTAGGISTLSHGFYDGQLVSVSPYASALTYNANGTLGSVTHQGSVIDTYAADPNGMPRPQSISVAGFTCTPAASIVNAPATMCANTSATATASPSTNATFVWTIDNGSIVSGATASTVTFTAPAGTATLHLTVTTCGSASAQATINVAAAATITQQPSGTTINSGSTAQLSVVVSGSNTQYQWYQGTPPNSTPVSGQTASTFTTPALTQTTSYWAHVTSDCGTFDSNQATVTVTPIPAPVLSATTQSTTTDVLIQWTQIVNASYYIVEYATNVAGPFNQLTQPTTALSVHHNVTASNGPVAYVYRVWSTGANAVRASVSNMDYAVTAANLFTDSPIQRRVTRIKGVHVKEVRDAIDAVRAAASTPQNPLPAMWPNAPPPSGRILAYNMATLYAPFNAARSVFGLPAFAYTPGIPLPASNGRVLQEHVQQLRDALR